MATLSTASSWTYAEALGLDGDDDDVMQQIGDARTLIEYELIIATPARLQAARAMARQMLEIDMKQLAAHKAAAGMDADE